MRTHTTQQQKKTKKQKKRKKENKTENKTKNKESDQKMDRGSEQTFSQRGHTDAQQVHAKMHNITKHQRDANQNHNKILLHTYQNGQHQKDKR